MRKGVRPGSSCKREVVAYRMDTGHVAGVPSTCLAMGAHQRFQYDDPRPVPKLGSLQAFVSPNRGAAEDHSCSRFSAAEVHKIAIFDMRILNCDRNAGNLLVRELASGLELVPIDHGFCLPDTLAIGWCDWCWLDWPQAKLPLSPELRDFILLDCDPKKDAQDVARRLDSPRAGDLVRVAGLLLQEGCRAGISLFEVANFIVRQDVDSEVPSQLEVLLQDVANKHPDCPGLCSITPPSADSVAPGEDSSESDGEEGFWATSVAEAESKASNIHEDVVWDEARPVKARAPDTPIDPDHPMWLTIQGMLHVLVRSKPESFTVDG